jgi:hypothetical protein
MSSKKKEDSMPAYGTAYGVRHYGSQGTKTPSAGATSPAAPSTAEVAPPPTTPAGQQQQQTTDPFAAAMQQLAATIKRSQENSGNALIDRLKSEGNDMWQRIGMGTGSKPSPYERFLPDRRFGGYPQF